MLSKWGRSKKRKKRSFTDLYFGNSPTAKTPWNHANVNMGTSRASAGSSRWRSWRRPPNPAAYPPYSSCVWNPLPITLPCSLISNAIPACCPAECLTSGVAKAGLGCGHNGSPSEQPGCLVSHSKAISYIHDSFLSQVLFTRPQLGTLQQRACWLCLYLLFIGIPKLSIEQLDLLAFCNWTKNEIKARRPGWLASGQMAYQCGKGSRGSRLPDLIWSTGHTASLPHLSPICELLQQTRLWEVC